MRRFRRLLALHMRVATGAAVGFAAPIVWMAVVTLMTVYGAPAGAVRLRTMDAVVERLLRDPGVTAARARLRRDEPATLATQIAVCEIPAPPFGEAARGRKIAALFGQAGLDRVRTDSVGNVIAERGGVKAGPRVVISAHLDTVFPAGTNVSVRREADVLVGPGIGDDCRGLAVLIALARVVGSGAVQPDGPVMFVATVGEEGLGDLRGVRYLFDHVSGIDRFISIDGSGLSIVSRAVGSFRYRVTFRGPGGHSYGNFGIANPIHALGRAVAAIADLRVPSTPRTTFNVGRVSGGTSVNAIAAETWMDVDLRSSDEAALVDLDRRVSAAIKSAVSAENLRWGGRAPVAVTIERTGTRPGGRTPDSDRLVSATLAITEALGAVEPLAEGSTDANIPMSRGISALTLGGGGVIRGAHSPAERFETSGASTGAERALLALLAAASTSL